MVNISKMVVMRLKTMKSPVRISGNVVLTIMDQCPYEFGTRGHCKKVNNATPPATVRYNKCLCVQTNLAYFPFMQRPLVAN